MKNWTIRQKIVGSFAILLLLMLGMGGVTLTRLTSVEEALADIKRVALPELDDDRQLQAALFGNLVLTQQLLHQEDQAGRAKIIAQLKDKQAKLGSLIAEQASHGVVDEEERQLFQAIKRDYAAYVRAQSEVVKLGAAGKHEEGKEVLLNDLFPEYQKVLTSLLASMEEHTGEIAHAHQQLSADVDVTRLSTQTVSLIGIVLTLACGLLLFRAVTKSGIQVTDSASEVASTAKQQQATAGEIAATTAEIGATSKEIWATSKELVKTMDEVSGVAEQSATLAGNGQAGLAQMEETMGRVMEAASSINTKLAVLNERAGNISQVVNTITKVADQTNLLSLNAAIEAEKAGEHGRGFSVVATEIRRLADQTAVATYDIEQMVKEIQSAVSAGVMGMDKFSEEVRRGMHEIQHVGSQLLEIIQQVQTLAPRVEAVNEGMQAQATGAEQISNALSQLSEAAQQSVESLRQSGMAIEDLNEVANTLFGRITRLKLT